MTDNGCDNEILYFNSLVLGLLMLTLISLAHKSYLLLCSHSLILDKPAKTSYVCNLLDI